MESAKIKLEPSWKREIAGEFDKDYMLSLRQFLKDEIAAGKTVYPRGSEYFSAFNLTPFDQVKVVILGQDPYHGPNQAHGLCFSVRPGVAIPPSLLNIYKELRADVGVEPVSHGYLESWAEQGVLLLNSVLTVERGKAASHQKKGWETFTDAAIKALADHRDGLVFILWGSYAQKKGAFIDRKRHLVLESPHPSPLSAHRGFLGSKPFSKSNAYLKNQNKKPIDWALPERVAVSEGQQPTL